jgi:hypothetical protein
MAPEIEIINQERMSAAVAHFNIATTTAGVGGAEGAALRVRFSSRSGGF